ncbi:hypothetical protein BGW37DRAFT_510499 [Umbelopsis sp. PMI_123]|nr:hypothetical protein BGW37DRAFT_510499 [Umbelopsis sp. PMI_123]
MHQATNEDPIAVDRPTRSSCKTTSAFAMKAYIGELDSTTVESDLLPALNHLGKVSSLRISRDAITGANLGYGFVEYEPSQSVRLLEEIPINGKSVKVMWSLRRTQIPNESETVVYLANLDKSIGEKTLRDTFSAFGSVISCTLLPDFGSGGTASITFDTQEAAKKAIKFINECLWNGEQITASLEQTEEKEILARTIRGTSRNRSPDSGSSERDRNILPPRTVNKLSSWLDITNDESNGSSIVNNIREDEKMDSTQKQDQEACGRRSKQGSTTDKDTGDQVNGTSLKKSVFKHDACQEKRELYIRNIDATLDERTIKKEFEAFVKVEQVRIVKQRKHDSPKTYGFVTVKSIQDANKLISEMNGKTLASKTLHISFAHSNFQKGTADHSRSQ